MSYMFEVFYRRPQSQEKEQAITQCVERFGGHLDYCEVPSETELAGICLTYEFSSHEQAERAAKTLRELGEHVEGPVEYGDEEVDLV